jgi:hypothetical protein
MTTTTYVDSIREKSAAVTLNGAPKMKLLQEALSRARMRRPQVDYTPEAHRTARHVAMEARQRAARELGGRPF